MAYFPICYFMCWSKCLKIEWYLNTHTCIFIYIFASFTHSWCWGVTWNMNFANNDLVFGCKTRASTFQIRTWVILSLTQTQTLCNVKFTLSQSQIWLLVTFTKTKKRNHWFYGSDLFFSTIFFFVLFFGFIDRHFHYVKLRIRKTF